MSSLTISRISPRAIFATLAGLGLTSIAGAVEFDGHDFTPLGNANAATAHDHLVISNIGASGDDGVEVDLNPNAVGYAASILPWDPDGTVPIGSSVRATWLGPVPGGEAPVFECRWTKLGLMTFALDVQHPVPASTGVLSLSQNGSVLAVLPPPTETDPAIFLLDPGFADPTEPMQGAGGIPIPPHLEWLCGIFFICERHQLEGVALVSTASGDIPVDPSVPLIIEYGADPISPQPGLTRIRYRGQGVPTLTFAAFDSMCEGDVDGNGVVDVNDITFVIPLLGQPGPSGDADGNGVVDVNDVTYIVVRLGDCGRP